jgi:hypothetical protein
MLINVIVIGYIIIIILYFSGADVNVNHIEIINMKHALITIGYSLYHTKVKGPMPISLVN